MAMVSKLVGRSVPRRIGAQFASRTQRAGHYPNPRTWSKQQEIRSHPYSQFLEGMRKEPIFVRPLFPCSIRTYLKMRESNGPAAKETPQKRAQATMMYLFALVIAMVGCTYAAVPLYRKFCQATGYGGTVQRSEVKHLFYQCMYIWIWTYVCVWGYAHMYLNMDSRYGCEYGYVCGCEFEI